MILSYHSPLKNISNRTPEYTAEYKVKDTNYINAYCQLLQCAYVHLHTLHLLGTSGLAKQLLKKCIRLLTVPLTRPVTKEAKDRMYLCDDDSAVNPTLC